MSRHTDPDERERKWLRIIEVAADEFARLGFDGANINTISTRAGLGKGTIYLYATSKEQLFLDVLREIGRLTRATLESSLAESVGAPVSERLHAVAMAFIELGTRHPDFLRLQASALFGVNRRFQAEMALVLRESVLALTNGFVEEQTRGAMRRVNPESFAVLFLGVLQTYALLPEALGLGVETPNMRTELLLDVLWRGLQPEGTAVAPL